MLTYVMGKLKEIQEDMAPLVEELVEDSAKTLEDFFNFMVKALKSSS